MDRRREVPVHARRSSTSTASRPPATRSLEQGLEASFAQHELAAKATRARRAGRWASRCGPAARRSPRPARRRSRCPTASTTRCVRDHCREHYGVMISGGQGAGNLVRIGHMGPTARSLYPIVGLSARRPHLRRPRRRRSRSAPASRRRSRCSRSAAAPCARDARALRAAPAALGRGGHRAARRARRRRAALLRRHRAAAAREDGLRVVRAPRRHEGDRRARAASARTATRS